MEHKAYSCKQALGLLSNISVSVPMGSQSMFRRFYVPKALYYEGSLLYSEGSIYVLNILCSECPLLLQPLI